ncbi:lytic transglycosylase domain-containing protein [Pseudoxanthomonas dokdonensis]|uniref:Transglycosylase SLT domain-containing protein n=1 Tax=Pseudoxanthomonas dokdonensis TaxID=344882 RepID=A0A0R0CRD0_9GAMM|nr:hypothetical protein ABB29_01015 [Pseudoxanthomonas dokdonensis]
MELMACPELAVSKEVMRHVVQVESSRNPYAIGVVGGHLKRQPKNLQEALATVRMLESKGYNFSVGIAQVNRYNLEKYGLDSYTKAFQVCPNLQAGARILAECYQRHQDWGKSFSCYYSGNAVTGFRHGYVQKIFASMAKTGEGTVGAIPVTGSANRKPQDVSHFPAQSAPSRSVAGISRISTDVAVPEQPAVAADPAFAGSLAASPSAGITSPVAGTPSAGISSRQPPVMPVGPADPAGPVRLQPTAAMQGATPTTATSQVQRSPGDSAFVF